MSEATVKARRREIRRAAGEQMLGVMQDQQQQVALLARSINDERTHRLKLAEEQRAYVDNEDRQQRACCQARWDWTVKTTKRLADDISELRQRTFWQRLRWLLTGR